MLGLAQVTRPTDINLGYPPPLHKAWVEQVQDMTIETMMQRYDYSSDFKVQVIKSLNLLMNVERTQSTDSDRDYLSYFIPMTQWLWHIVGKHWNNTTAKWAIYNINHIVFL